MDFLGIDLAKLTFDATLLSANGDQHHQAFANTPEGFPYKGMQRRDRNGEKRITVA